MERRFRIALVALALSLAALAVACLYAATAPPAPATFDVSQQVLSEVARVPLAPAGMSGEFAGRRLADAGALEAASVYHPSDWSQLRAHEPGKGMKRSPARAERGQLVSSQPLYTFLTPAISLPATSCASPYTMRVLSA
jgi:hypothetical protein